MNAPEDRDGTFEQLLAATLKTPVAGPTPVCLDTETLAAMADGALKGPALEIAQSHVADCGYCQSVLGALVRVSSAVPPAAAAHLTTAPRGWWVWAIPLTAATAALAIWVAVPRGPEPLETPRADARMAAPQTRADQPLAPSEPAPPREQREQLQAATKDAAPKRQEAQPDLRRRDADRAELDRLKEEANPAASPAAASPAPVARELEKSADSNAQRVGQANFATLQAAPERWRILSAALERSRDGGSTWQPVATGVTTELRAVSAPSPGVCWVVGGGGVVLRTTDGNTFSRVTFPEAIDLTAVQASSAQSAQVTAADGSAFTTTDGGTSWQRTR